MPRSKPPAALDTPTDLDEAAVKAVSEALNGLLADWNRTHLFNSRWTPHAKYHDAVTISLVGVAFTGAPFYLARQVDRDFGDNHGLAETALVVHAALRRSVQELRIVTEAHRKSVQHRCSPP